MSNQEFWQRLIDDRANPNRVIVKGTHYSIGPEDPTIKRQWRGFHGDRYVIEFNGGRRVVSTNLWCQGSIPLHLRGQLPDNAVFVKEAQ